MKFSRRVQVFIFIIVIMLLVGILFWPFVLDEIIPQISLVAWLLLRVFVLSIGQYYYWGALILVVVYFLFRFLFQKPSHIRSQKPINIRSDGFVDSNGTILAIGYWRHLFTFTDYDERDEKILKRELVRLVTSLYASKQHTSANFGLYEALRRGEIPLPEHIRTFLFPDELQESRRSFKTILHSIWKTPKKWIRRWTGQEAADYYRMTDQVLCFLETSLEMKNDDGKFAPNKH